MDRWREAIEDLLESNSFHIAYFYGPEGIGKRRRLMDIIRNQGFIPVEVPLISSYTALGNFLRAVWDHIPEKDRSIYMGMLRGAMGRFFAHYVPDLTPEIEKMGIDLSRFSVNIDVVYPHLATILQDISKGIVWVLNDYFSLEAADLRKLLNRIYEDAKKEENCQRWCRVKIVLIGEVDDRKLAFSRIPVPPPSIEEFSHIVGHKVNRKEYELVGGNPGVFQVLSRLVRKRRKDLRSYSSIVEVLDDNLTDREKRLYTALSFVSKYHLGRFGPFMKDWAFTLAGENNDDAFKFLEEVGLIEFLDYLSNVINTSIWRVQYTIALSWMDRLGREDILEFIEKSVGDVQRYSKRIIDLMFILSMHARDAGYIRRAHAYLILWIKLLWEEAYLQRVVEILDDLGYIDHPEHLPYPVAAYIARFIYRYFGSHPSLIKFAEYLKDYIFKKPLLLSLYVEFTLLYGDVSDVEVDRMLKTLRDFLERYRGYPVSVWIMWGIGRIYEELNSYKSAQEFYGDALSLVDIYNVPDHLRLELINAMGRVYYLQGRREDARDQWVKLLQEAKVLRDARFISKAYNNLAVYEFQHSFRYAMELFRNAYEILMGTTGAFVPLSNYLGSAYELISQDSYMERLVEAKLYIESLSVPFYTILFYSQTYIPLVYYRNTVLAREWETRLKAFFFDEGRKKVYSERYVDVMANVAWGHFILENDVDGALSMLKELETFAYENIPSASNYIKSIYSAYAQIGMDLMDKEIFLYGYSKLQLLDVEISGEMDALKLYFDGLKDRAIKMLKEVRRHYLRDGRRYTAATVSKHIGDIYLLEGNEDDALFYYRRALSEFSGMGIFRMISEIMDMLKEKGLSEKLFAGINEKIVEDSLARGEILKLWRNFEVVLDNIEKEIFVYDSIVESYQKVIGKPSVMEIAETLSSSIRFFVSYSVYVAVYNGGAKVGYGMSASFPGGVFVPKVTDQKSFADSVSGWHTDEDYSVYVAHKGEYSILVYIDTGELDEISVMYVEDLISLVLVSLPMLAERQHAIIDTLTGLYVRWYVLRRLDETYAMARRQMTAVGVLYMDIDNFKKVNDTLGHAEGDRVLREVARIIKDACTSFDIPGRYGGEEFVVILPATTVDHAMDIAEKIRIDVEKVFENFRPKVTISIGVAVHPPLQVRSSMELLDMADMAMYWAKRHGKNRVVFASEDIIREVKGHV